MSDLEKFTAEDLDDLRGEHVCCDYTCTFDGTMRRAADEIERLRLNAECHPAACRDEMLWRDEIVKLKAASADLATENERLRQKLDAL